MDRQSKIILISGPTASGKSNLALKIAKKINGEIINADSMQVYKSLKILTARPTKKHQGSIKHHLYGVVDLDKNFSPRHYNDYTLYAERIVENLVDILLYDEGFWFEDGKFEKGVKNR